MWRTIQGVPQNSGAPGWFFCVEFSEKLQPNRKALWNHETRSQAAGLYFMMQLEKVVSQAQQRPFHFDLDGAAEKEPTKAHVFLNHGENALCSLSKQTKLFSLFCGLKSCHIKSATGNIPPKNSEGCLLHAFSLFDVVHVFGDEEGVATAACYSIELYSFLD